MNDTTTEQDGKKEFPNINPTGKGGFGDNPENINAGGRPKNQESFTYWLNYFKGLTVTEFKNWQVENPEDNRTVASNLAFQRIANALGNLKEFQEVADRTEGRSTQPIKHSGGLDFNLKKVEEVIDTILEGWHPPEEGWKTEKDEGRNTSDQEFS